MNQSPTPPNVSMNASINASMAMSQPQSLVLRPASELTMKLENITELVEGLSAATHIAHGLSDRYILADAGAAADAQTIQNANDAL